MFYGRCKNGEYVNNFFIIFVLLLFFNFKLQKCAINIWQDFFRSVSVHELLCAIVFFSNGFEIHLLCSQLSPLTNRLVLAPVIVLSFDYNYALYKTETS